jgi:hypothetical protein
MNWRALEKNHPRFMASINLKAANHYMKVYKYLNKEKAKIVHSYDVRSDFK